MRLEDDPIELFYQGIKSKETRASYARKLRKILCENLEDFFEGSFEQRVSQFVCMARDDPDKTVRVLLSLSRLLKKRTELDPSNKDYLNPSSFGNFFKPIKKLLDMNGVGLAWKRIYATFPEIDNLNDSRGYTREEIRTLLAFAQGALDHALILVAASSGARTGGLAGLKWGDLDPVYRVEDKLVLEITESQLDTEEVVCAMLRVYSHTDQEYPAFITPEAYKAILAYRKSWTVEVMREPKSYDPLFKKAGPFVKPMTESAIRQRMARLLKRSGIRTPLVQGRRLHEIPTMNGFRRFWNKTSKETISKESPLGNLIKKEYMMGHTGLTKLDRNYFKTHILELAEDYLEIVPHLTISDAEREKVKNKILQTRNRELEEKNRRISDLERRIRMLEKSQAYS